MRRTQTLWSPKAQERAKPSGKRLYEGDITGLKERKP